MRKMNLHESDINMIRWGAFIIVTTATKEVTEKAIELVYSDENHGGIDDACYVLNNLGYFATWENFDDMRLEIKL